MCKLVGCASRANYIHSQSCAHRVATGQCIHPRKPCEELDVQCDREELREEGAKQELEHYNYWQTLQQTDDRGGLWRRSVGREVSR